MAGIGDIGKKKEMRRKGEKRNHKKRGNICIITFVVSPGGGYTSFCTRKPLVN